MASSPSTSSQSPNQHAYVYLLPLAAVLIWSVNVIVTKLAVGAISALSISFYRWVLAFVLLSPFVLPKVWRQRQLIWPYLPKLAVLGLLGMLMYQGLAYEAAHTTSATNIGILNAMIPLFTIAIAAVLLREKPTLFAIMGGIISLTGIMVLIAKGNLPDIISGHLSSFHLGDLLMLLAVFCYAAYGVFTRLWQLPLDLLTNIYLQIGFGMLFHIPFVLYDGFSPITAQNIWLVLYAGTLPSLVAPLVWVKSIQLIGPSRTSIFINLTPLLTATIAVFYLNEHWFSYHSIGALMILGGVIMAQLGAARKNTP